MKLSQINPFIRYAHYFSIDEKRCYGKSVPLDNRFFYILSKKAKIAVAGKVLSLFEGDVVIIPAGFEYELLPMEQEARYLAVNFDYTQVSQDKETPISPIFEDTVEKSMCTESVEFTDAPELNAPLVIKGISSVHSRLVKIEKEYTARLIGFNNVISGFFCAVIIECVRANRAVKFGKNEKAVTDILEYIEKNFASPLTGESIAEVFGLHPNYLSYLVKCYTGTPVHRYLLRVRVSHAMNMLRQGEFSVGEVARECGFPDIYHFSKVFKQTVGVPPSKYPYIM